MGFLEMLKRWHSGKNKEVKASAGLGQEPKEPLHGPFEEEAEDGIPDENDPMWETRPVYEGYYFAYHLVPNGYGGYHPVHLSLNHKEKGFHKKMTDGGGWFLDFPGIEDGREAMERMSFSFSTDRPSREGDLLDFYWTVQPDGRYYADEDGFGMEDDVEIVLVAGLDREGRFTEPFHTK